MQYNIQPLDSYTVVSEYLSYPAIMFSKSKLLVMILFYWHTAFSLQDVFAFYYFIIYTHFFLKISFTRVLSVFLFLRTCWQFYRVQGSPPCWDCWKMYIHEVILLYEYFLRVKVPSHMLYEYIIVTVSIVLSTGVVLYRDYWGI